MKTHHPILVALAEEAEALHWDGKLDSSAFDALIARASAAGLSKVECFPLYQFASLFGVLSLGDHFPPKGRTGVLGHQASQ